MIMFLFLMIHFSGSLVAYQTNRDFLPKPPANQTQHEVGTTGDVDYFDILEASEEEDEQFHDYIVDARSDLPFLKKRFRGEFRANFKKQNNSGTAAEFQECDPISALLPDGYERKEMLEDEPIITTVMPSAAENAVNESSSPLPTVMPLSPTNDTNANNKEEDNASQEPTSGSATSNKMLVLDTPFSWILRDKEIGEVFYGSVSSLCQYNRAVHHIPTVPVWVLDLFKAFYWRCV